MNIKILKKVRSRFYIQKSGNEYRVIEIEKNGNEIEKTDWSNNGKKIISTRRELILNYFRQEYKRRK